MFTELRGLINMSKGTISIEDILVNIILGHTRQCITPLELNVIARELSVDDILSDEQCKAIAKRVVDASGYILEIRKPQEGERYVDRIVFVNPDEGVYHVKPGTRPTEYFKQVTDPTSSDAQGLMFKLMKDYDMYQKGKNLDFVKKWNK